MNVSERNPLAKNRILQQMNYIVSHPDETDVVVKWFGVPWNQTHINMDLQVEHH